MDCSIVEHWGKFDPTGASVDHGEEVDIILEDFVGCFILELIVHGLVQSRWIFSQGSQGSLSHSAGVSGMSPYLFFPLSGSIGILDNV